MEEQKKKAEETVENAPETEQETETVTEESAQEEATIEQWQAALEIAVKQRDEYLAMAQRAQADYQNFKRRNAQTRTEAYDEGVRETLAALLPVIDNLERALDVCKDGDPVSEGVRMTYRQMLESLGKLGLEEIPSLGEKFDPDLHNAVMRGEEGEPGTVTEVYQKGYRVKERIIRYAMVKIAAE